MAATGKTPILLYGSTTPTNAPSAGNLTNSSDGCEIAINVADKNLFFKDSTNAVNTVPFRQSSASSNGWLSSTDWNTFNNKASTSSPTFSGDVTLSTGNLVIGTSGKGIDFSATAGTGTSELLADYEEGTWTGTLTAVTPPTTPITATGTYTKVGRLVMYNIYFLNVDTTGSAGAVSVTGLPYTVGATAEGNVVSNAFANPTSTQLAGGSTTASIVISQTAAGATMTATTGRYVFITGTYNV